MTPLPSLPKAQASNQRQNIIRHQEGRSRSFACSSWWDHSQELSDMLPRLAHVEGIRGSGKDQGVNEIHPETCFKAK